MWNTVGCGWIFDQNVAVGLHPDFYEFCVGVYISKDGKQWSGIMSKDIDDVIYGIGERKGTFINFYTHTEPLWDTVHNMIISDKLGHPHFGINPLSNTNGSQESTIVCTCDNLVIRDFGCPSMHGNTCPDRKWEG